MSGNVGREVLEKILRTVVQEGGFDRVFDKVKLIFGANGMVQASLKIDKEHQNRGGMLHGGLTASLVDSISTLALLSHPKATSPGVSVNMNISYLKAVKVGEEILINASTDKVGKVMAYLSVDILNQANGEIVAKGSHTKFLGGSTKVL